MSFKHLSLEERHYIEIELKKGISQKEIATSLGRSQSSVSREINRNRQQETYCHKQADQQAKARHQSKPKKIKLTDRIKVIINGYIEQQWSPEQIAGRLKLKGVVSLHHETIYQHIASDKRAGGELYTQLRHQQKSYRKRYGSTRKSTGIPNRIDIDERPEAANNRERIGDWEGDTIIGKNHKGAILTLDERKSKLRLAFPLLGKKARQVEEAAYILLNKIKPFVKTITFDNGMEFSRHEHIAKEMDCDIYFAKPYHSWERGQNENANGLLRQYFPKQMELTGVSVKQVFAAVHALNSRPRKCLGYKTPYETFKQLTGTDIEKLLGYAFIT